MPFFMAAAHNFPKQNTNPTLPQSPQPFSSKPLSHLHLPTHSPSKTATTKSRHSIQPSHTTLFLSPHKKIKNPEQTYIHSGDLSSIYRYKLSFFCNNFERNFYRNFLVKFNDSFVVSNFFYIVFYKDNLAIDVVTQLSQFISNLNAAH